MTRYQQLCQALPQNSHTWLITGVAGFIGSDLDDCHKACQGADYVLHQAALGSVPRSVADPNGAYAAVIPKWIASMINNEPVYINGDGETSRDFCFIANAVQANLLAATTPIVQGMAVAMAWYERQACVMLTLNGAVSA